MRHTPIRLVYHMYVKSFDDAVSKIHFYCLGKYINVFNEALFIISLDDVDDTDLISAIETRITSLGFKGSLRFKIIKNDPYKREAETFYYEIVEKLNDLDGITFFAHSKGYSNKVSANLCKWIAAMYFFGLDDLIINQVKDHLLEKPSYMFDGFNPVFDDKNFEHHPLWYGKTLYNWTYHGSFYWMNTQKIAKHLNSKSLQIPKLTDRYYAENFPGNVCPFDTQCVGFTTDYYGRYFPYWYDNADYYIKMLCGYKDSIKLKSFNEFYLKMLNDLKICKDIL